MTDTFSPTLLPYLERIVLAALFGGMIGLERDWTGHSAGLRTNMMIAVSACLFIITSQLAYGETPAIAAQIVTGVGFLGAGAVIHSNSHIVKGLTTASSIWLVAAIGLTVGIGQFTLAMFVTLFAIAALRILEPVSRYLETHNAELQEEMRKASVSATPPRPARPVFRIHRVHGRGTGRRTVTTRRTARRS